MRASSLGQCVLWRLKKNHFQCSTFIICFIKCYLLTSNPSNNSKKSVLLVSLIRWENKGQVNISIQIACLFVCFSWIQFCSPFPVPGCLPNIINCLLQLQLSQAWSLYLFYLLPLITIVKKNKPICDESVKSKHGN